MPSIDLQERLRKLPGVDRLLSELSQRATGSWPHDHLTRVIQCQLDRLRELLRSGQIQEVPRLEQIADLVAMALEQDRQPSLKPVLNASGILLHTNLGRAPLAAEALEQVQKVAEGYSNLELNLKTGRRGSRHSHVEGLLCTLGRCEAAMVVNNNAGAVLLALTALARGREAVVSRGELVEIGGSFRIPEVMEAGGVTLREVGSSNRTHLKDYQQAISPQTGLLLKVHTSNYRVVGFTSSVSASELRPLAKQHDLPLVEDLGSGLLGGLPHEGLPEEPTIADAVATGVDILTCSGDKLLGGPQAGLILGRRKWLDKLRSHPLARALRIDKLSLAALEATLRLYLQGQEDRVPLRAYFSVSEAALMDRSRALEESLASTALQIEIVNDQAMVGGGAMPGAQIPGPALSIRPPGSLDRFTSILRSADLPLLGRIHEERLLLNLRTIPPQEDRLVLDALLSALKIIEEISAEG